MSVVGPYKKANGMHVVDNDKARVDAIDLIEHQNLHVIHILYNFNDQGRMDPSRVLNGHSKELHQNECCQKCDILNKIDHSFDFLV